MARILHVITGLDVGGAEIALERLTSSPTAELEHHVLSMRGIGAVGRRLAATGVPVTGIDAAALGARRTILAVRDEVRRRGPSVVATWMHHGNVIGGLGARAAGRQPIAWSLRSSDLNRGAWKRSTAALARIGAPLSHVLPSAIVCGSEAAQRFHSSIGYSARRMVVIQNGVVVGDVPPDARDDVRAELGIPPSARLVGRNGRFHPQKDHATFLAACGQVMATRPDVHVVMFGEGVERTNADLMRSVASTGADQRVHLLGRRDDIVRLHASLDVSCSSSIGEGFPNVVVEAMAVGTPVAGTDVGDTALIVGDTGLLVPPSDAQALGAAIGTLLDEPEPARAARRDAARERVIDRFGLDRMVAAHEALYRRLADA